MVAGVRGNEATTTTLSPYWKGDKQNDPAFAAELAAYQGAQTQADQGEMAKAAASFAGFVKQYPQSELRPQAEFGHALALLAAGNRDQGQRAMETFVAAHPDHPLVADARAALDAR
jgi:outer membrane protein assembly factor BamD (BamD/ComL family)